MRFMSTRLIADLQCSEFVIMNFHPATCLVACGTCWILRWAHSKLQWQFAATRATATPLGLKAMCWEMKTRRPIPSHDAGKWCRWWVDVKKSWVLAHHRCRVMLCFLFDIWMFLSSIWVCAIVHANGCHSAGLPTAIWYLPRLLLRQGQDVKIMLFGHGFIAWGEIIKHPGDRCWSYKWPCYARPSRATLGLTMRCVRFAMVYGGFMWFPSAMASRYRRSVWSLSGTGHIPALQSGTPRGRFGWTKERWMHSGFARVRRAWKNIRTSCTSLVYPTVIGLKTTWWKLFLWCRMISYQRGFLMVCFDIIPCGLTWHKPLGIVFSV